MINCTDLRVSWCISPTLIPLGANASRTSGASVTTEKPTEIWLISIRRAFPTVAIRYNHKKGLQYLTHTWRIALLRLRASGYALVGKRFLTESLLCNPKHNTSNNITQFESRYVHNSATAPTRLHHNAEA